MNPYLIDTHCHLHDPEFFTPKLATEFLKNAQNNNVKRVILIGTSHQDSFTARDFALRYGTSNSKPIYDLDSLQPISKSPSSDFTQNIFWSYGIHPEFASQSHPVPDFAANASLDQTLSLTLPTAIGEVGLDYHYPGYSRQDQIRLFEEMIDLAMQNHLPLIFHVREAFDDFWSVIDNFPGARGVVHSFTSNKKNLKKALDRDFYIGINGLSTYSTIPLPPLEKILLETDAPFLTPVPHRGKINQPAYIKNIAEWLAQAKNISLDEVTFQTTKNATELFNLP